MGLTAYLLENRIIFETIFAIIMIAANLIIFVKTNKIYRVSNYRSIRYFSLAFLYWGISLALRFITYVINTYYFSSENTTSLILLSSSGFLSLYFASLGGFHLSYSLVRKTLDKEHTAKSFMPLIHILSLAIALIEIFLLLRHEGHQPYLLFTAQMFVLLFSLVHNYSQRWLDRKRVIDSHFLVVLFSIGVFFVMFLGDLINSIFPASIVYANAVISILTVLVLAQVVRIIR